MSKCRIACEQKKHKRESDFLFEHHVSLCSYIRVEKFYATKALTFSLHFLFRRDQNTTREQKTTSEKQKFGPKNQANIMKMCEQILEKRQRPDTIQIL